MIEALLLLGALTAMALLLWGVVRSTQAGKARLGVFSYPETKRADGDKGEGQPAAKGRPPRA